jgi:hypothetical protein
MCAMCSLSPYSLIGLLGTFCDKGIMTGRCCYDVASTKGFSKGTTQSLVKAGVYAERWLLYLLEPVLILVFKDVNYSSLRGLRQQTPNMISNVLVYRYDLCANRA